MENPRYSVIVPVYNRPEEVGDLLQSLLTQTISDFEVLVVEDGSTIRCEQIVTAYSSGLAIRYFFKPNSGPGPTRNFGYAHARGQYFVVFDSDCIIPSHYFQCVDQVLKSTALDAWGGPDRGHEGFTRSQQAMAYTMSSFLTTGGIRGGKKGVGWFQPRSFNMGISRKVFEATGGFHFDRFAEDIEFSIRMKKAGFSVGLISEAFVYHRRRATFAQFFRQVFNFGKGRAQVGIVHPTEVKLTHWFPTIFTVGCILLPLLYLFSFPLFAVGVSFLICYLLIIFFHSLYLTRRLSIAALSVISALLQLWGYGVGFAFEKLRRRKSPAQKGSEG